jgi:hypothetical protein
VISSEPPVRGKELIFYNPISTIKKKKKKNNNPKNQPSSPGYKGYLSGEVPTELNSKDLNCHFLVDRASVHFLQGVEFEKDSMQSMQTSLPPVVYPQVTFSFTLHLDHCAFI